MSSKKIYDNVQCVSSEGVHMFYCTKKKAMSYLRKGIGEMLSEEPLVFRLLFEPKGYGNPDQLPRENKCVVCETEHSLTKHHVIPYALRKLMSAEFKDHRSEDIVPICEEHHRQYEISSRNLMLKLLENSKEELEKRELVRKAKKLHVAVTMHGHRLSEEKKREYDILEKYVNLELKSDFRLIMEKYSEREIYELWRKDFVEWMKKKNIENFELKK